MGIVSELYEASDAMPKYAAELSGTCTQSNSIIKLKRHVMKKGHATAKYGCITLMVMMTAIVEITLTTLEDKCFGKYGDTVANTEVDKLLANPDHISLLMADPAWAKSRTAFEVWMMNMVMIVTLLSPSTSHHHHPHITNDVFCHQQSGLLSTQSSSLSLSSMMLPDYREDYNADLKIIEAQYLIPTHSIPKTSLIFDHAKLALLADMASSMVCT